MYYNKIMIKDDASRVINKQASLLRAVQYIREYKAQHPIDILRENLQKIGYPKELVDRAVSIALGEKEIKDVLFEEKLKFFDFRTRHNYISFRERILDFLFGFFGILALYYFIYFLTSTLYLLSGILFLVHIGLIVYLWKRRHYIAHGLLFAILLPFLLVGLALLFFFGLSSFF